jgi:hypothetical protein
MKKTTFNTLLAGAALFACLLLVSGVVSDATLKTYFEAEDEPTEAQFVTVSTGSGSMLLKIHSSSPRSQVLVATSR